MNIKELLDTIEAKIDLLASQQRQEDRQHTRREIEDHLEEVRSSLGLPDDFTCCSSCGSTQTAKCHDCGETTCAYCDAEQDDVFLCGDCRCNREFIAEEDGESSDDTTVEPGPMMLPYPTPYQMLSMEVQRAYHDLRGLGYECYADLLCCQTCALSAIHGNKYVYWHSQDNRKAERDGTLLLGWGGDGEEIVEAMRDADLEVEWDGSKGRRIAVRRRRDGIEEVAA